MAVAHPPPPATSNSGILGVILETWYLNLPSRPLGLPYQATHYFSFQSFCCFLSFHLTKIPIQMGNSRVTMSLSS